MAGQKGNKSKEPKKQIEDITLASILDQETRQKVMRLKAIYPDTTILKAKNALLLSGGNLSDAATRIVTGDTTAEIPIDETAFLLKSLILTVSGLTQNINTLTQTVTALTSEVKYTSHQNAFLQERFRILEGSHQASGNAAIQHGFVYFPKLPLELRHKVWELALSETEIIQLTMKDICEYCDDAIDYSTTVFNPPQPLEKAAILFVCKEARAMALKVLKDPFEGLYKGLLWNERADILWATADFYDEYMERVFEYDGLLFPLSARNVAINANFWYDGILIDNGLLGGSFTFIGAIQLNRNLEVIIILVTGYDLLNRKKVRFVRPAKSPHETRWAKQETYSAPTRRAATWEAIAEETTNHFADCKAKRAALRKKHGFKGEDMEYDPDWESYSEWKIPKIVFMEVVTETEALRRQARLAPEDISNLHSKK